MSPHAAPATCRRPDTAPAALAADVGGFDVVVVAAGNAQLSLDAIGLLRRGGVACLLGIDGRDQAVSLPGPVLAVDAVIENRVVFGSVNANIVDWRAAVERPRGRPRALARRARPLRRPPRPAWTTSPRRSRSAA